ncbi:MAG TPA: peptidase S10 [Gammaproteobacteria bacterium]|jgi:carboxypeptidase C (cathepsin A)|nr:peptidase S10 [Gammaproteobacteria bacterium]
MKRAQIFGALLLAASLPALADDAKPAAPVADQQSATQGSVTVGGKSIAYTANAGTLVLKDSKGEPTATMSYVAYFANGASAASRPIMFIYNGGPGSSTIWLHMASFGPKRALLGDAKHTPPAAYQLVSNEYSLLDATDLVFVDAVGTGFGRVLDKDAGGKGEAKDFYGVDQDGKAFTQFIERFLTKYSRWNSPKYLFGESYGTPRSAVVANDLVNDAVDLNGVILLSAILNFDLNADFPQVNPSMDLPYAVMLPTQAAAAWYHKKAGAGVKDLPTYLHQVEDFAMHDYLGALQEGSELSADRKRAVAQKMSEYIGLPVDYLMKANLRVTGPQFEQQLLQGSEEATGRFDVRYAGPQLDPLGEFAFYDPQSSAIGSPIVSLFNDYIRGQLKFGQDLTYLPVSGEVGNAWDFKHQQPGVPFALPTTTNVMPDLASAMAQNPDMKVMLNSGYYDLATPYYSAVYVMHHLPMPDALQKNISYEFYPAGHMVYVNLDSLKLLHDSVAKFIASSHK